MRVRLLCFVFIFMAGEASAQPNDSMSKQNPLHVYFRPFFPDTVATKGEAVQFLLAPIQYRFITVSPATDSIEPLARELLPKEAQPSTLVFLETYLQQLAGPSYRIVIDHPHKVLTFELIPSQEKELPYEE